MVPADYTGYFTTVATAASALVGLLFVAIALRPDTVFGPKAPPAGRALAGSAFTALVNTFFVSLLALVPDINLGYVAVSAGTVSFLSSLRLARDVGGQTRHRLTTAASMAAYGGQVGLGVVLIFQARDRNLVVAIAYIGVGAFSVALGRAWALLGGEHLRGADNAEPRLAGLTIIRPVTGKEPGTLQELMHQIERFTLAGATHFVAGTLTEADHHATQIGAWRDLYAWRRLAAADTEA